MILNKKKIKNAALFLLLFASIIKIKAQDIRIPYRVGDKFGLSDEMGRIIVAPNYDKIHFMENGFQYFQYTNYTEDSVQNKYTGQWQVFKKGASGVLYKDNILIKASHYPSFRVYKEVFIVGAYNDQRPENCMLYNLQGSKLLEEEVHSIYFNDKRDVGHLGSSDTNLILISIFHKETRHPKKISIAVYNVKKQRIEEWLVQKVSNYKLIRTYGQNAAVIEYMDERGRQKRYLHYKVEKKEFALTSSADEVGAYVRGKQRSYPNYGSSPAPDFEEAPPLVTPKKAIAPKKAPLLYFTFKKDGTLHYGDRQVDEISGAKYVKASARTIVQYSPVIYQLNGKYGLLHNASSRTKARFDTLVYVKGINAHLYLTGKIDANSKKREGGMLRLKIYPSRQEPWIRSFFFLILLFLITPIMERRKALT